MRGRILDSRTIVSGLVLVLPNVAIRGGIVIGQVLKSRNFDFLPFLESCLWRLRSSYFGRL